MQNTSLSQIYVRAQKQQAVSAGFAIIVLACLLWLACMVLAPQTAFAKDYTMPQVDIQARVDAQGTLHVREQRSFSFRGNFTCVWWEFDDINQPRELVFENAFIDFPDRMLDAAAQGNSATGAVLKEVPFETSWRSAGGPGVAAYSVDVARSDVYVFFEASDETMVVTLEYSVVGAVDVYTDCAELYWQFLGSAWAEDSRNVTATIGLPANGKTGVAGSTVRAWGHGPLSGSVDFNEAATEVSLNMPRVKAGQFAEARVVFPREWLSVPDGFETHSYAGLDHILAEEERWAREANRGRIASLLFFGVFGLVALVSILWSLVKLLTQGLEYKPNFRGDYWRDVPHKGVHPAVIGRLCRWNKESSSDVLATILHLANLGSIGIHKGIKAPDGTPRPLFQDEKNEQEHYYLSLNRDSAYMSLSDIDTNLINFLFGDIAKDRDYLWLDEIDTWGEAHKKSFNSKLTKWQKLVTNEVKKQQYFEDEGSANQDAAWTLAAALGIGGAYISYEFVGNWWPFIILGIAAVVVFLLSIKMPRRTQAGADDYAHAQGLKKWLKDFTLLDERPPTDVKVWGEFMVYAQLFGIAEQTMRKLRDAVPELFAESDTRAMSDAGYVPWHTWYVSDSVGSTAEGAFSRSFDSMWQNTSSMAAAAASASSGGGGGGWSSFSGGGGGFSGGGGGGFGGGGGGAR